MGMTRSDDPLVGVGNDALTDTLIPRLHHGNLCGDSPVLVLVFLSEEFDTLVYLDVLLATDVRGLEFVF
jgi:hypothetical protein